MRRMADSVNVEQQNDALPNSGPAGLPIPPPVNGVVVYSIDGPVFFGIAEKLERTLAHIQRPATTLILRMGNVPFVDATGLFALEEIITDFKRHGATVLLVEVRSNVRYKLERSGVITHVGQENVIDTLEQALLRAQVLQTAFQR
jgi:SulP family sulfate permease